MPNHIDLAQVKAMKVVNYATLRETLKSGDLFSPPETTWYQKQLKR